MYVYRGAESRLEVDLFDSALSSSPLLSSPLLYCAVCNSTAQHSAVPSWVEYTPAWLVAAARETVKMKVKRGEIIGSGSGREEVGWTGAGCVSRDGRRCLARLYH